MDEASLLQHLSEVEARHLGVNALSNVDAVRAALEARRAPLAQARTTEPEGVFTGTLSDPRERAIFLALCRRLGLNPHRHARQRRSTVVVSAPALFYERVLWPEFVAITTPLLAHFDALTERVLSEVLVTPASVEPHERT